MTEDDERGGDGRNVAGGRGAAADLAAAAAFLTRIPVPVDPDWAWRRGAAAAWAYPVIGALVGAAAGLAYALLAGAGVAPWAAAWTAVAVGAALTGALHEDGLADAVDGLGAPRSRARALEIMRDSRMGAFGAVALVVTLGARAAAIGAFDPWGGFVALVAAGAVSRAAMVGVWGTTPAARADGLAADAGRPNGMILSIGCALGVAAAIPAASLGAVPWLAAFGAAAIAAWLVRAWALRRIGGQTGDVLGATQQVSEAAALTALTIGASAAL